MSPEAYRRGLDQLHIDLGITAKDLRVDTRPIYLDNQDLIWSGLDFQERHLFLTRKTDAAWRSMRAEAAHFGITLLPVSGYRSVKRQFDIISTKLAKGLKIEEVLRVNAAPGFSQHHTGCALDLADAATSSRPLDEVFDQGQSFEWLLGNGHRFGFRLEYKRDNRQDFIYEPWHWVFEEVDEHICL